MANEKTPKSAEGSSVDQFLKRHRRRLEDSLSERGLAHTLSLARFRLHRATVKVISSHANGSAIDVGSGHSPFLRVLEGSCSKVLSVDAEDRAGSVDLIVDIEDMVGVEDATFDTVLCTQVLEHVPRPWRAMREIHRVLRPGGKLLMTVPHLSAIHEAPHDFYRYTQYGLQALCKEVHFEIQEVESAGGLVAFLSHGVSYVLMSTLGVIPGLNWAVWGANYLLLVRLLEPLDWLFGMAKIYPCNFVMVASKLEP